MQSPSRRDKYTIIIPAAGLGRRMKVYGPKSLIKINDTDTILSHQINIINSCFNRCEIIVVGGFQFNKLHSDVENVRFIFNPEYEETNVIYSIGLGLKRARTEKVLIIYGDLVFNLDCVNLPFYKESAVVISDTMKTEEVGCIFNNNVLDSIFYKLPNKWAHIAFFTGYELALLYSICLNESNSIWYGFEAINNIIASGGQFGVFHPNNARAVDIDSSYDLKLINKHEILNTHRQ